MPRRFREKTYRPEELYASAHSGDLAPISCGCGVRAARDVANVLVRMRIPVPAPVSRLPVDSVYTARIRPKDEAAGEIPAGSTTRVWFN